MDEANSTPTAADRERAQPHDCWCGMWPLYPNIDSLDDGSKKHTRTFCGTFAEAVAALTALAAAREAAEAERDEARAFGGRPAMSDREVGLLLLDALSAVAWRDERSLSPIVALAERHFFPVIAKEQSDE